MNDDDGSWPFLDKLVDDLQGNIANGVYVGIDTQFDFLRESIGPMLSKQFWVIGGYTSAGKSFFAVELVVRALRYSDDSKMIIFSTEMSNDQYLLRIISNISGVPSKDIRSNSLSADQNMAVNKAYAVLRKRKRRLMVFDDIYEFQHMKNIMAKAKRDNGLDFAIIDYIQNVKGTGPIYDQMANLSKDVQAAAKEIDITIIALSQVSNEFAKGEADIIGFKGAGEIAACSDVAIILKKDKKWPTAVHLDLAKTRHGVTGKFKLRFSGDWTRLEEV